MFNDENDDEDEEPRKSGFFETERKQFERSIEYDYFG